MKPLAALDPTFVDTVLLDIDDTLTTGGKLNAYAYAALERLHTAGKRVVPVTGRPAGWCDHIARMWPVDGVVGENGAFYFYFSHGRLRKRYLDNATTRTANRARLEEIAGRILRDVPGCALASDQAYRETDLAIDYCEDVEPLSLAVAGHIAALMQESGLTARISSIHVNGWFGIYDKLAMSRLFFSEVFGLDIDTLNSRIVFAGDSPNDSPMFAFFANSVGVQNVRRFEGRLSAPPKYVTTAPAGEGFAELAAHLLKHA